MIFHDIKREEKKSSPVHVSFVQAPFSREKEKKQIFDDFCEVQMDLWGVLTQSQKMIF